MKAVNKKAQQWMSIPVGQHVPVMESMFTIAIESIGKAGLGKTFKDSVVNEFAAAYSVVCFNVRVIFI